MRPAKKNIQKWIDALRSGKYTQCEDRLQKNNSFCCLGVACKIFISEKDQVMQPNTQQLFGITPQDQPKAPTWLKKINLQFETDSHESFIEYMNDIENMSFDEIADMLQLVYIEDAFEVEK
jgi:hypothetical protein